MNLPPLVAEALSDRGLKHFTNEDAFTFQLPSAAHSHALFLIADGVSSLGKSDVASQLAADIARETYYNASDSLDLVARVDQSIQAASAALRDAAINENLDRMGTTIAGIALTPTGDGVAFNVGDSRVYQIRNKQIKQLSKDQVSTQQVGLGFGIEPKRRSTKLSAFVGQSRPLEPVLVPFQAKNGDIYLICTDGLWSLVTEQELYEISTSLPIAQANRKFIDTAKERGAPDNVTIMTVRVGLSDTPRRTGVIISGIVIGILAIALILFGVKAFGDRSQATAIAAGGTTSGTAETLSSSNLSGTALAIPAGTLTLEVSASSAFAIPASTLTQTATTTPIPPTATKRPTIVLSATPTTRSAPTIGIVAIVRTPSPTHIAPSVAPTATATNTLTVMPATATNTLTLSPTRVIPSPTKTATATLTVSQTVIHSPTATLTATSTKTPRDTPTATLSDTPTTIITVTNMVGVAPLSVSSLTPIPTKTITSTNTATATATLTETAISSLTATPSATGLPKSILTPSSVQISPNTPTFSPTPIIRLATITQNAVRIRAGDSLDHAALGTFNKGDIVTVLGVDSHNQGWYLVKTQNGVVGWVAKNYIEFKKTSLNEPAVPYVDPQATEMTYTPSPTLMPTLTLTETAVVDPGNSAP